nr:substrate-binding domain-containing protein [Kineococcus aurantiacus]
MSRRALPKLALAISASLTAACSSARTQVEATSGVSGGLISIIVGDEKNAFWQAQSELSGAEAKRLGYTVQVSSSGNDLDVESALVDQAIAEDPVALIIGVASADGSVPALERVRHANIPAFLLNTGVTQDDLATAVLTSDNTQGAILGATEFARRMRGSGTYVELLGLQADANAKIRSDGYASVLSKVPMLQRVGEAVADWDVDKGHDAMVALLKDHPDIKGVLAGNDGMARGAAKALDKAGRRDVIIGAFDGSPEAVDDVRSGVLAYTILQPVEQFARKVVLEVHEFLLTGTTGAATVTQSFDCELITAGNAADYVSPFVLR